MARLLCALLLLTTASICPAASEAKTYADCILENMKGINSDVAAQAIKDACAARYNTTVIPDTENETAEISQTELKTSDKLKYCQNLSTGRLSTTELRCGKSSKDVSKLEYLRLQSLQAVQNQRQQGSTSRQVRQPRSQQTYSQPQREPSFGKKLEQLGNIMGGYPTAATAAERREIDRQKADDCEQALRMNTYRKINGQSQKALPIGCY